LFTQTLAQTDLKEFNDTESRRERERENLINFGFVVDVSIWPFIASDKFARGGFFCARKYSRNFLVLLYIFSLDLFIIYTLTRINEQLNAEKRRKKVICEFLLLV
jgi:hypothetical protein